MEPLDKINLLNYDAPEHSESRYVLTSPRSLRACSNLGIKPTELLFQSVEKFRQSKPGMATLTGSVLEAVYEEFEKQRKVKLQRARKERLRLIELDTTLAKKGHVTPDNRSSKASMLHRAATREAYMYSLKKHQIGPFYQKPGEQTEASESLQQSLVHESFHSNDDPGINQELFKLDKSLRELTLQTNHDAQKVAARQHQQLLKKMEQEKRYQTIVEEEHDRLHGLNESLTARHKEAEIKRITLNETKILKLKMKNVAEKERFEYQQQEVEQEKRLREESLKESLISKHINAEQRLETMTAQREDERRKSLEKKREKELHRLEVIKRLENEFRDWQERINHQIKQNMQMAAQIHDELIADKVIQLRLKRQQKWQQHLDIVNRLRQEEEEQRQEILELIAKKNQQTEEWKATKKAQLSQSLMVAQTGAKLRQLTRSESSFAEMVQDAKLRASFENQERQRKQLFLPLNLLNS